MRLGFIHAGTEVGLQFVFAFHPFCCRRQRHGPLVTGSTGPADRPSRIGLHERTGMAEANRHLGDAFRRVLGRGIILGMRRVKGLHDALRRALDSDGRSLDDPLSARREKSNIA